MFQNLCFCLQSNDKDKPNTITLEDAIIQNTKNDEKLNTESQPINNKNIMEEEFNNKETENNKFYQNGVLVNNNGVFMKDNTLYNSSNTNGPILTINNINNININLQRNSFSKEPTKLLDKKDSKSDDSPKKKNNDINEIIKQQTMISGENSREILQNKSFISFSNLTIKYNNNPQGSSINFSDTEIISSCEITLIGDLFFNKEIKLDRSGIKNINMVNTNRILQKGKNKKVCEIKFGVSMNNSKLSSSSLIKNNEEKNNKNNNQNINKINKFTSMKNNQKKKIQSISSLSSVNNSIINKNYIDIILNLPYNKVFKKLNQNPNNNINNNENIVLFILKYDTNLDMFQLTSTVDDIPVELLLNYNYPLRFQQNYNILVGGMRIDIKVIKNDKNESILNIIVLNDEDKGENKNGNAKSDIIYRFNPFIDRMPITIGRINCDICLNNISVSKLHAQIDYIYDYDEFFLTDCKSTNGTYFLLKSPLNSIYIKRELHFKLFESKFKIHYVNFN
jgi:hypothetical protein